MGCDVFYRCRAARRDAVERAVALVERHARESGYPCRVIDIRNCALEETGPWQWPVERSTQIRARELARQLATIAGAAPRPPALTPGEIEEMDRERDEERDCLESCRRGCDLYGVVLPPLFPAREDDRPELASRGQLVFNFRAGGRLVRLNIAPRWDGARDTTVPCSFLAVGGYWRSIEDYMALPRFLACLSLRYLPALDVSSDYDEKSAFAETLDERPGGAEGLVRLSDDEFYKAWMKERNIFG
jgi:hypothetical protein